MKNYRILEICFLKHQKLFLFFLSCISTTINRKKKEIFSWSSRNSNKFKSTYYSKYKHTDIVDIVKAKTHHERWNEEHEEIKICTNIWWITLKNSKGKKYLLKDAEIGFCAIHKNFDPNGNKTDTRYRIHQTTEIKTWQLSLVYMQTNHTNEELVVGVKKRTVFLIDQPIIVEF